MLDKWIYARHRFNHGVSKRRIKETINQLDCSADHGLIIVTNSWGSRKALIFNELYVDFSEEIMIVEGVFDAIKSKNAVPILGSTIRETSKLFKRIVQNDTPVLLALDPDAKKKTEAIKKMFLKYGIEVRQLKYEDERDLGDMTKKEVKILSEKAKLVNSYDSLIEAIVSL